MFKFGLKDFLRLDVIFDTIFRRFDTVWTHFVDLLL